MADREMIERVALSIANSKRAKFNISPCEWRHLTDEARLEYCGYAVDAIKAMREPTEKMEEVDIGPDRDQSEYWRAMIDSILND